MLAVAYESNATVASPLDEWLLLLC